MKGIFEAMNRALSRRGGDGLTSKERTALAKVYRDKAMKPLTNKEMEAFLAWRERRM